MDKKEINKLRKQVKRMSVSDDCQYQDYEIYKVLIKDINTGESLGYKLYAIPCKCSYHSHVFQSEVKPLTEHEVYDKMEEFHIAIDYVNHVGCFGLDSESILRKAVDSYRQTIKWIEEARNETSDNTTWTQISVTIQDAVRAASDAFGSKIDHYEFTRMTYWFIRWLILAQAYNLTNNDVVITKRNK